MDRFNFKAHWQGDRHSHRRPLLPHGYLQGRAPCVRRPGRVPLHTHLRTGTVLTRSHNGHSQQAADGALRKLTASASRRGVIGQPNHSLLLIDQESGQTGYKPAPRVAGTGGDDRGGARPRALRPQHSDHLSSGETLAEVLLGSPGRGATWGRKQPPHGSADQIPLPGVS